MAAPSRGPPIVPTAALTLADVPILELSVRTIHSRLYACAHAVSFKAPQPFSSITLPADSSWHEVAPASSAKFRDAPVPFRGKSAGSFRPFLPSSSTLPAPPPPRSLLPPNQTPNQ